MYLHEDKDAFNAAIGGASRYFNLPIAMIEKDYFVTIFLKCLVDKIPSLLFKGGTSLSKCYHIINRFSEDIDISSTLMHLPDTEKRRYKRRIEDVCDELELSITNLSETFSGHDFNRYLIDYHPLFTSNSIKPILLLETSFRVKTFPYEIMTATSLIGEYYEETKQEDIINKFELSSFTVCVQSLERTLIDKVFALCDHYLNHNLEGYSRHIYDIYKIIPHIKLNEDLRRLFNETREELITRDKRSISASREYDINSLLIEIIDKEVYRSDYTNTFGTVIFDHTTYDECVQGLKELIKSNVLG